MSSQIIPVDPFDCIIFGGTGDLAERKLLPALYHRQKDGQMTRPTRIIGASRSDLSTNEYRAFAQEALKTHVKDDLDSDEVEKFLGKLDYVSVDVKSERGWDSLGAVLGADTGKKRACYLAVGPSLFGGHGLVAREEIAAAVQGRGDRLPVGARELGGKEPGALVQ